MRIVPRLRVFSQLIKPFSALAGACLLVAACGGGGSSSRTPAPPPGPDPDPDPAGAVLGSSFKGIIIGGEIDIQEVLEDGSLSDSLGSAVTDGNGDYDAEVSADYAGGALKITLTAVDGTTMICDAPSGCGTAAFGDEVALAEGFSLCAYVPSLEGDSVDVHVTPVTDMAAKLAESDPDGLDATAVAEANDVVRQTFSLPGDITSVRPVDLTDPAAVAAADADSQQIAVLSAGILEAVQQTDAVTGGAASFEDAIDTFSDNFASQGGLVLNDTAASEGTIVSLDDILGGASSVVDEVQTAADEAGVDANLDQVETQIDVGLMQLPDTPSDDPVTDIEPIDTATAEALEQAKAFIEDLRDLTASAALDEAGNELDDFTDSLESAFEAQIDSVTGVVTNDLDVVVEALSWALGAIDQAYEAAVENPELTTFDGEAGGNLITVAITSGEAGVTLSVDQAIDEVDVTVDATVGLTISEAQEGLTETLAADGTFIISGLAANEEFSVAINDGSEVTVDFTEVDTESADGTGYTNTVEAPVIAFALDVTLTALAAADAPSFDGSLDLGLDGLVWTESESQAQGDDGSFEAVFTETVTLDAFTFGLAGTFSDNTGTSVEASLVLAADNADGFVLESNDVFGVDGQGLFFDSSTETEETAENFVQADATLTFAAALPGIDQSAAVTFAVERSGVDDAEGTVQITFDGKSVTVSGDSVTEVLTLTNQDGVQISVDENEAGDIVGAITVAETEVGTIEENEDGVVIVRYSDGSFEALGL